MGNLYGLRSAVRYGARYRVAGRMIVPYRGGLWGITDEHPNANKCRNIPGFRRADGMWVGHSDAISELAREWEPLVLAHPRIAAQNGLRAYQRDGAHFLLKNAGAVLSDDMGLGKTRTALEAARAVGGRVVVVCPNYVREVWVREIRKWWPGAVVVGVHGTKPTAIPDGNVIICHYDILYAWADALASLDPAVVILDECHLLGNDKTRQSKAARILARSAKYRWGLTGTLLTNRPRDLWNIVDTLCPGRFGGFFPFALRYCDAHKEQVTPTKVVWKFDGKSNTEELKRRLSHFVLRRTKKDVALELPPMTRSLVYIDVKAPTVRADLNKRDLRAALDKIADLKIDQATDIILQHVKDGSKVVAFCHRRAVAEQLSLVAINAGLNSAVVHGGVPLQRRMPRIADMAAMPAGSLLCVTIDSTATGIDLSYASVACMVELTYEPHEILQAEARLHRFGQANPVLIQYLLGNGTLDDVVMGVLLRKLETVEQVVGKEESGLPADVRVAESDIMSEIYAAIESSK